MSRPSATLTVDFISVGLVGRLLVATATWNREAAASLGRYLDRCEQ